MFNNKTLYDPYDPENPINKNDFLENNKEKNIYNINKNLEEKLLKCSIDDIPEFGLNGIKTIGKIVDVYDGDTCKIILINDNTLMRFNCRLKFIDTPELKPAKNKPNREIEIQNAIKFKH